MNIYFWPFTFAINGIFITWDSLLYCSKAPRVCMCDLFHKLFLFSKHTAARSIDGLSMAGTVLSLRRQPAATYYSSDGVVSRNRRWHVNIYVNVCVVYTHRNAGTRQWSWRRRGIHCIWHKRGANWVPSAWAAGVGATLAPSAIIKTQNFNTSTNHSTKAR